MKFARVVQALFGAICILNTSVLALALGITLTHPDSRVNTSDWLFFGGCAGGALFAAAVAAILQVLTRIAERVGAKA
jgi:hypothetical protein